LFNSINESIVGGAFQGSIQGSIIHPNSNNQMINWNIDLVKQNTNLKKENRELKELISQIENLVTSASDNLIKKKELGEICEEIEHSPETVDDLLKNSKEHHDSIINKVNNFIHEMSNLQTEMQG
jgi:polyhydroxyalkanoate synthesis regulator phasin